MSIPTKEQADTFLAPLRGNLSILLLHDVQAKLPLSRFILRCASRHSLETTILDTDAFYCTNMERFAEDVKAISNGEMLLLPKRDFEVISLVPLLSSKRELLIIDNLNSLYSLASEGRRLQQLVILFRLLSYNARMNGSWVVATAYRIELPHKRNRADQHSLTALGDLLIDTEFRAGSIHFMANLKGNWPNGQFSL